MEFTAAKWEFFLILPLWPHFHCNQVKLFNSLSKLGKREDLFSHQY